MMSSNEFSFILMTGIVCFLIGLSKGGLGGTLGALATPLMTLVLPPEQAIGLLLPILMLADPFAVGSHWLKWDRRLIWLLLPGAIVGVAAGMFIITKAPTQALKDMLGAIALLFAIFKLIEARFSSIVRYQPRNWHGYLAGSVAGLSSTLAHTGGPPISIYLILQNISPRTFVATSALFFMVVNWIKLPYYYYTGLFNFSLLTSIAWLLPFVPFGVWIGRRFSERIPKNLFDLIIVVLLAISGILLLMS